jgi:hypothetical protein
MGSTKLFIAGLIIGIIVGAALFYAYTMFAQVSSLQSQITELQNTVNELKASNVALPTANPEPTAVQTATPQVTITPQPQSSEGTSTRYEKLQFNDAYAQDDSNILITLENTGTAPATIINVLLNDRPLGAADRYIFANGTTVIGASLQPGETIMAVIQFASPMLSGIAVEIAIQTAAGNSYLKTVQLP